MATVVSPLAYACLWDSSVDRDLLNANPVSVCINAPTELDRSRHFSEFREAEVQIRRAVQILGEQTSLNFNVQQGYCRTDSESLLQPQIRLTLDAGTRPIGAIAGENFPHLQTNVVLPYLPQQDGRAELTIERRLPGNFLFLTQHEILHLFGIQHDDRNLAGGSPQKRRQQHPEYQELSESPAEVSIMNILPSEHTRLLQGYVFRENMGLTPEDIQCVNRVVETQRASQGTSNPTLDMTTE